MIKYFCDRCKEEITGDIYRVKITAETQNKYALSKINDMTDYATSISNVNECFVEPPMYCKDCKEKFEIFLKRKALKE